MKLTIEVTADDIAKGRPSCEGCPVWHAARRAALAQGIVGTIRVHTAVLQFGDWFSRLPPAAREWIKDYDSAMSHYRGAVAPPGPITFEATPL